MSIEWMDNFQSYGTDTTKLFDGLWAAAESVTSLAAYSLVADPDPLSSGNVLYLNAGSGSEVGLRRVFSGNLTTVGVMRRVYMPNLPSGTATRPALISLRDAGNSVNLELYCETTGALSVYRGSTLVGSSSGPVITANAWNHIEMKAIASTSATGTVIVRVAGVTVINLTNVITCNTANAYYSQVVFASGGSLSSGGTPGYVKDVLTWNANGSQNNDLMGDIQVITLRPAGDTSMPWTPSTGTTGYNLVNKAAPDDSSYIYAPSSPSIPGPAIMSLTHLPTNVVSIKGLMPVVRMKKTDGGVATVVTGMKSNGVLGNGSSKSVSTTFTSWFDVIELDPNTSAAWTPVSVNAALLQINRTS